MSSSALRYADELIEAGKRLGGQPATFVAARGGGTSLEEYGIHQIEMIVALLGAGARRVQWSGNADADHLVVEYADARRATLTLNRGLPFAAAVMGPVDGEPGCLALDTMSGFFPNLIASIVDFFATGRSPIAPAETIEIAAILAAGIRAKAVPGVWVEV